MPKPNWNQIAEENGITAKSAQNRWIRLRASVKEEKYGPVPEATSRKSRVKKKKRRFVMGDDGSTSEASSQKVVKQEVKVEQDPEEPAHGMEEAQETSVEVKVEKDTYV